jgi:NAD(P)-dependent dehydrogenase (short-subunit alcohol dehydrogenase family)
MPDLHGKLAFVTGGMGRIGSVLCAGLRAAGARVFCLDINGPIRCDATNRDELENVLRFCKTQDLEGGGVPDILVNCVQYRGQGFYSSRPEEYPLDAWEQTVRVNLTGTWLPCQVFGRAMLQRGSGVIVNFSSTYGLVSPDPRIYGESGVNSPPAYAASKAAIIGLTRYLAVHWAPRIRVNAIAPGGVYDQQDPEFVRRYCDRTPLGRMARAEDYVGAVLYLCSDDSAYTTGSVLTVDGGWTAW